MEKLDRVIGKLKELEAGMPNREGTIDSIVAQISTPGNQTRNIYDFIFGWSDIRWIRGVMASVSIFLVLFFFIQQSVIVNRISGLEERVIEISTENILEGQKENVLVNAAIFKLNDEISMPDSIKVSGKDLKSLVTSYRDLQKQYEELQEKVRQQRGEVLKERNPNEKIKL